VVQRVGDDHVAGSAQRAEHAEVRHVARAEHERGLVAVDAHARRRTRCSPRERSCPSSDRHSTSSRERSATTRR
jgi:hypothetical protein